MPPPPPRVRCHGTRKGSPAPRCINYVQFRGCLFSLLVCPALLFLRIYSASRPSPPRADYDSHKSHNQGNTFPFPLISQVSEQPFAPRDPGLPSNAASMLTETVLRRKAALCRRRRTWQLNSAPLPCLPMPCVTFPSRRVSSLSHRKDPTWKVVGLNKSILQSSH